MDGKEVFSPKWMEFDKNWYCHNYQHYMSIINDVYMGDVETYYVRKGCQLGHSPNPYFDERWYLLAYPDVAKLVKSKKYTSGFNHYCQEGYKNHSPHWLFSEEQYLANYADTVQDLNNFMNGYHHFLEEGDMKLYSGSLYFNPHLYLIQKDNIDEIKNIGPYQYLLTKAVQDFNQLKISWFFDGDWYLKQYSQVKELLSKKLFSNSLQHYLSNNTPLKFYPNEYFSEKFYLETYKDLAAAIAIDGSGNLRNGYAHFVLYGCNEGRKPCEDFDPKVYMQQPQVKEAVKQKIYYNVFECWVAHQEDDLCNRYEESLHFTVHKAEKLDLVNSVVEEDIQDVVDIEDADDIQKSIDLVSREAETELEPEVQLELKPETKTELEPDPEPEPEPEPVKVDTLSQDDENVDELEEAAVAKEKKHVQSLKNDKESDLEVEVEQSGVFIPEDDSISVAEEPKEKIVLEHTSLQKDIDKKVVQIKEKAVTKIKSESLPLKQADIQKDSWKHFDADWYVKRYPDVISEIKLLEIDNVETYYSDFGCLKGHSPNPYFDEIWYLNEYPDVALSVERGDFSSGFAHYLQCGYHDHSPHWLFSEKYYRSQNTHLTDENLKQYGFLNGYDHYLRAGDFEGLKGSIFFDPHIFIGNYTKPIEHGLGIYSHYLKNIDIIDPMLRVSWYFDPVWYLEQYPEVENIVKDHNYINPLHHYLTNEEPADFSPLFWFDERFYNSEYAEELENEDAFSDYRNGYDHFIHQGIARLWRPLSSVDLGSYSLNENVIQDIENKLYPNIFVHWIANHKTLDDIVMPSRDVDYEDGLDDIPPSSHVKDALWAKFDTDWYITTYPDVLEKMEKFQFDSAEEYYNQIGAYLEHSPNPYFDESWYLNEYPNVQKLIRRNAYKTGFEHYCKVGYKKYSPHWLFSSTYYEKTNPQFYYDIYSSGNYVNAYDHYLKKGDTLRCTGSLFFDPLVYERTCYQQGNVEKASFPYRNFLLNLKSIDRQSRVSIYFDTQWYVKKYPEVQELIDNDEYRSALHHYLTNVTPTRFNPLPFFSEEFYLQKYPDLSGAILENGKGAFRNGYDHFIFHGALECRQPSEDIDLKEYISFSYVQDDIENGLYRDAFAHWVFHYQLQEWIDDQPEDSSYRLSEETQQCREYFRQKARYIIPMVAHKKLDFSYEEDPDISVVMLLRNQVEVTLTALASLRANFTGKIQLLLGDNYSTDDTRYIQQSLVGAEITHFAYNLGYGRACNFLIGQIKAPITVFLNNDICLQPGSIDVLRKRLMSSNDIGLVGGKIIHPDGCLQEAGSIIWRDGTTTGYLRGEDPLVPEANFVRDVDYCSTAMAAMKTLLLQQLKGFDPIYYPAYFEDTDLCVRILQAGYRVVYDPDAVVEHMEYASSDPIVSSGLIRRNHKQFVKTHSDFLRFQKPRHSENIVMARQRDNHIKRILFFEDRVPLRSLGSGYVRSNDIVRFMAKLGYAVTIYPINGHYPHLFQIYQDIPETVEVLYDHTIDMLQQFFKERAGYYDMIWIGRTHNLNRILPMMGEANRYLPQDKLILDTEVIAAPRTRLRSKILDLPIDDTLDEALEVELSCARHCQEIVVVNDIDADYVKYSGFTHINILGHYVPVQATPKKWQDRKGLLFVGALHDNLSPNYDSLKWFLSTVLPIILDRVGKDISMTIAGYVHPSVDMSKFTQYSNIKLIGSVNDLTPLYNDHRVYVAPTRFAGGIPHKLHEAASFGIPIVATELLVKQLGWQDNEDILAASIDNPDFFASQIIRLYQEQELWDKVRNNALYRIGTECNEEVFQENLQNILTKVTSHK